jgi:hypothetical protein
MAGKRDAAKAALRNVAMLARKLALTRRIRWFEDSTGSPSFNHAWFLHDHLHKGPPTLAYA